MSDNPKILVLILTYNEENGIREVILSVNKVLPNADVLVVDGGSRDKTIDIANELGAIVLLVSHELGIGGAVETGYLFADQHDYDYLVRVDGDGQHNAEDIEKLMRPVVGGQADVIIGGRLFGKHFYKASLPRAAGIKLFSFLVSRIIGRKIHDTTSGLYVTNRKVIRFLSRCIAFDYSEVSAIILLHRAGFVVREIPVVMKEREQGVSSFTPLRAFFYVFNGLLSIFVISLRKIEADQ